MKKKILLIAAALAVALPVFAEQPVVQPKARVEVIFDHPEKFTDVRDSFSGSEQSRDGYLGAMKEYLEKKALRHLAPGQSLSVTFTNIDMACVFEANTEIRIIKNVYPARMNFSFRLTDAAGAVLKEGTRNLIDTTFQMRMGAGDSHREGLFYEKALLEEWLREEFGRPQKRT